MAACVSLLPGVRSLYRWQGRLQRSEEVLLLIKSDASRTDALRSRLPQLHPYQVPEVLMFTADDGLPAYLDWLSSESGA